MNGLPVEAVHYSVLYIGTGCGEMTIRLNAVRNKITCSHQKRHFVPPSIDRESERPLRLMPHSPGHRKSGTHTANQETSEKPGRILALPYLRHHDESSAISHRLFENARVRIPPHCPPPSSHYRQALEQRIKTTNCPLFFAVVVRLSFENYIQNWSPPAQDAVGHEQRPTEKARG